MQKSEEKKSIYSKKKWKDFSIKPELENSLVQRNNYAPTLVQANTLIHSLDPDRKRLTLIVKSPTGTGKTFVFLIPILNSVDSSLQPRQNKKGGKTGKFERHFIIPQAIVITNKQQLNQQLKDQFKKYLEPINKELLKRGAKEILVGKCDSDGHQQGHILVMAAKSLMKKIQNKEVNFENLKWMVADEADDIQNFIPGFFIDYYKKIKSSNSKFIFCSASIEDQFIQKIRKIFDQDQVVVSNIEAKLKLKYQGIMQYLAIIDQEKERHNFIIKSILAPLFDDASKKSLKLQLVIFFNEITQVKKFQQAFSTLLQSNKTCRRVFQGLVVKSIHGKLDYEERVKIMAQTRNQEISILLATDIIGRGIDIRTLTLVINQSVPSHQISNYFHRIGRTGRYSDIGVALTVLAKDARLKGQRGQRKQIDFQRFVREENEKSNIKHLKLPDEIGELSAKIKQAIQHNTKP